MDDKRIELTDSEWMSLIDGDRDGLMRCCANISELRDALITVARNGGDVGVFDMWRLKQKLSWCTDHDFSPVLQKVVQQLDIDLSPEHEVKTLEE